MPSQLHGDVDRRHRPLLPGVAARRVGVLGLGAPAGQAQEDVVEARLAQHDPGDEDASAVESPERLGGLRRPVVDGELEAGALEQRAVIGEPLEELDGPRRVALGSEREHDHGLAEPRLQVRRASLWR